MKHIITAITVLLMSCGIASGTDLEKHKATYKEAMEAIVVEHGMNMTELCEAYSKGLDILLSNAKRAGSLKKATTVIDEISRFQSKKTMPDKPSDLLDIKQLQSKYTQKAFSFDLNKARNIVSLAAKYDNALEKLQRHLVKSDKLNDAKEVQEERNRTDASAQVKAARELIKDYGSSTGNTSVIKPIKPPKVNVFAKHDKEWTYLADVEPESADVGYGKLEAFKTAGEGIGIAGEKFDTGFYAHATSSIKFNIDGKGYTDFSTSYGMKTGAGGAAVFSVIIDGEEKFKTGHIWSYGKTKTKGFDPVEVKIAGAKELELRAVGVRGGAGAWSCWGNPRVR